MPVLGEVLDVVNGIWYLAEGDYRNAAISGISSIPIVGNAAKLGKYGVKANKATGKLGNRGKVFKSDELKGIRIINKKYAGDVFKFEGKLGNKYPKGVKFTKHGFPDFGPYSKATVEVKGLIGDHYYDFKKANEAIGVKRKPEGYTWHHVEDGKTMMLVPTDIHQKVRHTGGASLIKKGIRP